MAKQVGPASPTAALVTGIADSRAAGASVGEVGSQNDGAQQQADGIQLQEPCTIKGLGAAFGSGLLGGLFGFFPSAIRNKASNWAVIAADSSKSASSFALMGGVYTLVQCLCQRVRQVDDSVNRAVAGCASGIALSWQNGPIAAAQSCACIAAFSYVLGGTPAAEAATIKDKTSTSTWHPQGQHPSTPAANITPQAAAPWDVLGEVQREVQQHLAAVPRMAWLAPCCDVRNARKHRGCNVVIGQQGL